jgi:hypothetical protein
VDECEQFLPLRPVQRSVEDGGEEVVQEIVRSTAVAAEAHHAVRGEVRAVVGDGVQEHGAARTRGSGEPYRAPAREQAHKPLTLLLPLQERQPGQ